MSQSKRIQERLLKQSKVKTQGTRSDVLYSQRIDVFGTRKKTIY